MMETLDVILTRDEDCEGSIDVLPEQMIGIILSHVASARNIARAAVTCQKFYEAVRHHVHKLTFDTSDICRSNGGWRLEGDCEAIISEAIFKIDCLEALSICMEKTFKFQAGAVIAWLLYTKKTLKSLKFMNKIHPSIQILEKLGAGASKLQHLELRFAYIPKLNVGTHAFPRLLSLSLQSIKNVMADALKALLVACPKLESLSLKHVHISSSYGGDQVLETSLSLESFSLTKLQIVGGLGGIPHIILLVNRLETLTLTGGSFRQVKLLQEKGYNSFRSLLIEKAYIRHLELGDLADSLYKVKLSGFEDLKVEWIKHFPLISRASNLRKLRVCGGPCAYKDNGLHEIFTSFSCLYFLALDYYCCKALDLNRSAKLLTLNNVVVLELASQRMDGEFASWICEVLRPCYKLQRLRVCAPVPPFFKASCANKGMSSFVASMVQVMRPYPHVDLQFKFS